MIPKVQSTHCLRTVPETTSLGFHLLSSCRAGGEAGEKLHPSKQTPLSHTHTHTLAIPDCIQCPNWYCNPAEGGGEKKRDCVKTDVTFTFSTHC